MLYTRLNENNTSNWLLQIYQEAKKFGKVYNIKVVCAYGGGSMWEQSKACQEGAEIIVATPVGPFYLCPSQPCVCVCVCELVRVRSLLALCVCERSCVFCVFAMLCMKMFVNFHVLHGCIFAHCMFFFKFNCKVL